MNILCLIFNHDWRSVKANKQRKCCRCKKFQVKDYFGTWVTFKPKVTELYPVNKEVQ